MHAKIRLDEPAQLSLLPPSAQVRRFSAREVRIEIARVATTSREAEPLDVPLREKSLRILYVLRAAERRDEVTTTRALRHLLRLPNTETATRNLERMLKTLRAKGVIDAPKMVSKGAGRPPRVWRLTPAGVAELLTEHAQTCAEQRNREILTKRRSARAK